MENTAIHKACALSGLLFSIIFALAWWPLAQFFPPHSPGWDATAVAEFYQARTTSVRFGMMLAMFSAALLMSWAAALAIQMRRIEGSHPILSYVQVMAGAGSMLFFTLPPMLWTLAAFRPERHIEVTLAIHDFGWLMVVMAVPAAIMQNLSFALAILSDKRENPLFPRWSGYLNIWVALLFLPSGLITFFKDGPFAWDGAVAFWLPAIGFFTWIMVTTPLLFRAIDRPN